MSNPKSKYHLDKIDFTTHFSNTPRYFIAGGVLIHSFIKNHQDIKHIKIHILEDNITPANKKKIQKIIETDAKNYNLNIELAWVDITEEIKWVQSLNISPYHGSYADICGILSLTHIQPISDVLVSSGAFCLFDANLTKLWYNFLQSGKPIWNDDPIELFSTIFYAMNLKFLPTLLDSYRKSFRNYALQYSASPRLAFHELASFDWAKPNFENYYFGSSRLTVFASARSFGKPKFYKWMGAHVFPNESNANPNDDWVIKWRSYAQETCFANIILPESTHFTFRNKNVRNYLKRFFLTMFYLVQTNRYLFLFFYHFLLPIFAPPMEVKKRIFIKNTEIISLN